MTVSVHEAKTQLSKLIELVEHGEDVVFLRHGRPVANLVRATAIAKPQRADSERAVSPGYQHSFVGAGNPRPAPDTRH